MWADEVLPRLRARGLGADVAVRTFRLTGIGESAVAEILGEELLRRPDPEVATYARVEAVDVRVSATGTDAAGRPPRTRRGGRGRRPRAARRLHLGEGGDHLGRRDRAPADASSAGGSRSGRSGRAARSRRCSATSRGWRSVESRPGRRLGRRRADLDRRATVLATGPRPTSVSRSVPGRAAASWPSAWRSSRPTASVDRPGRPTSVEHGSEPGRADRGRDPLRGAARTVPDQPSSAVRAVVRPSTSVTTIPSRSSRIRPSSVNCPSSLFTLCRVHPTIAARSPWVRFVRSRMPPSGSACRLRSRGAPDGPPAAP